MDTDQQRDNNNNNDDNNNDDERGHADDARAEAYAEDDLPEELDCFDGDTTGDNVQGFVSDFALEARFAGGKKWYAGKVTRVNVYHADNNGTRTYDFRCVV